MAGWVLWLVLAAALAIGAIVTRAFIFVPLAIAAGVAAVAAYLGLPSIGPAIVFVVALLVTLLISRRMAVRRRRKHAAVRARRRALVGRRATVLERIANSEGVGCVRIGREVWNARSYDEEREIAEGTQVEVVGVRGATALVID
jgi:membrane protein implicated in regulation of membrane protease activity